LSLSMREATLVEDMREAAAMTIAGHPAPIKTMRAASLCLSTKEATLVEDMKAALVTITTGPTLSKDMKPATWDTNTKAAT